MEDLELGRGTPVKVGGRAPVRSPFAAGGPLCENHIHIAVACQRSCKIGVYLGIVLALRALHRIEGDFRFPQSSPGIAHGRKRGCHPPVRHPYRVLAGNIIAAIEERDAGSKRLLERCHRSLTVPQGIQGDATKIVKDAKILRDGDILRRRGVHRFQNRAATWDMPIRISAIPSSL